MTDTKQGGAENMALVDQVITPGQAHNPAEAARRHYAHKASDAGITGGGRLGIVGQGPKMGAHPVQASPELVERISSGKRGGW